ncbi:MAG: hypothetical protein ACK5DD_10675 [Cyclobacteriaceae bacterium]|jgi:hypothetical protein
MAHTYYKVMNGKKLDGNLLSGAEMAVSGVGDGRISLEDAHGLFKIVHDAGSYTDVEKDTMEYIRDHYKWTEAADTWFRKEVASWSHQHTKS